MNHSIIIGSGISGMSLAQIMIQNDKKIVIFDDNTNSATAMASGLYCPIFVKHYKKVWKADTTLKKMHEFYKGLSNVLPQKNLCIQKTTFRILKQNYQRRDWVKHMNRLQPYVSREILDNQNPSILSPYGLGVIKESGVVDTPRLEKLYKNYLRGKKILIESTFEYKHLQTSPSGVSYKGIKAKYIVFAEGMQLLGNPFFNFLPLKGNKGEWLIIKAPHLKLTEILRSVLFVIPAGKGLYKVGASYESNYNDSLPSKYSKDWLVKLIDTFIDTEWEIVDHKSGIRPTVFDRRALVGVHPKHPNIFVLNGLGSRGILTAPYLSQILYNHIEHKTPIPSEIDISRFS